MASPAWDFTQPSGANFDFTCVEDRRRFADLYMERLRERRIDVIALTDHNTGDWIPDLTAAGERHGVVVFPGVEITTASGMDGVHLLLIGDLDRTKQDVDVLLAQACGFGDDHPRFNLRTGKPASAPRTVSQILDVLPEQWLAVAPHALSENGLASPKTIQGDLRWKALHHERLGALDPGEVTPERLAGGTFNARFLNRTLAGMPCLARMPFIATSDAYSLDKLGSRFTWIRMDTPSKEALRQAFLDYEARIIPNWDPRLTANPDPNVVDHGWVESVELNGKLGNSSSPLRVDFDPRLNVVIGGRGTGKSTVVSALRQLYGRMDNLPASIQGEAEAFVEGVFADASLTGRHRLAISRDPQKAQWSSAVGSLTTLDGTALRTRFPMRIFSQKELFERTAHDRRDRFAASRHLFSIVDEALEADPDSPGGFSMELDAAFQHCFSRIAQRLSIESRLGERPQSEVRERELLKQIEAFGDATSQDSRLASERILRENAKLGTVTGQLGSGIDRALEAALAQLAGSNLGAVTAEDGTQEFYGSLAEIKTRLENGIRTAADEARSALDLARGQHRTGAWGARVEGAEAEILAFQERLSGLGIEPTAYLELTESLATVQSHLRDLDRDAMELDGLKAAETDAWAELSRVYDRRRRRRERLFDEVAERSGSLKFEVAPHGDSSSWVRKTREHLGLRSDGFVDEVFAVSEWLWEAPAHDQQRRRELWTGGLLSADLKAVRDEAGCKATWWSKLTKLESTQRVQLAMILPDDAVVMHFLRDGGKPDNAADWQPVTTGSPGQRSAAMLSFVLHHGTEPLVLDQPEDDLDTAWISQLIVPEIRKSRWHRQVIVITHNANIPVNADAERVIVLENDGTRIKIKSSAVQGEGITKADHAGPIEIERVRQDIQDILEGGTEAFMARERRYNNELNTYRAALRG